LTTIPSPPASVSSRHQAEPFSTDFGESVCTMILAVGWMKSGAAAISRSARPWWPTGRFRSRRPPRQKSLEEPAHQVRAAAARQCRDPDQQRQRRTGQVGSGSTAAGDRGAEHRAQRDRQLDDAAAGRSFTY
jgi:hypothetical protein